MDDHLIYSATSPMVKLVERIRILSNVHSSITIVGESGSGKEGVARLLHSLSNFKNEPFLAINCANFSEYLLESELFGYKEGSFTGAIKDYDGLAIRCGHGTLFLDEFDSLGLNLQAKFLRLLENRTFLPLGSSQSLTFEGRVIIASNKNLVDKILDKSLRTDLFYRLNVFTIEIPPLRDRDGDISFLSYYFLSKFNEQYKQERSLSANDLVILNNYDWPGNVRELKNCLENFVVFGNFIDFFTKISKKIPSQKLKNDYNESLSKATINFRRQYVQEVLARNDNNQTKAAMVLGINRTYLARLLKNFNKEESL